MNKILFLLCLVAFVSCSKTVEKVSKQFKEAAIAKRNKIDSIGQAGKQKMIDYIDSLKNKGFDTTGTVNPPSNDDPAKKAL